MACSLQGSTPLTPVLPPALAEEAPEGGSEGCPDSFIIEGPLGGRRMGGRASGGVPVRGVVRVRVWVWEGTGKLPRKLPPGPERRVPLLRKERAPWGGAEEAP